ncbi:MAG: methylmalonyl-CoA mutase family protein, partial [Nocardioidaceae bacterium]
AESHVAAVTDPAGGAHAVEKLTDDLARAAWIAFGRIEEGGGIAAALGDGSLMEAVGRTAAERTARISERSKPITGVSEFPHLHETLPQRRPYPDGAVPVARYGAPFEALRDDPAATPVFLATMGPVAAHTARATFAANLLAAGGIDTVTAGATDAVEDVLATYDGAPVVCLAGNDTAYEQWGAALVTALREAGAGWVVLAGDPGTAGPDVDDSAAVGVDALAFCHRTREHLSRGADK